MKIWYLPIKAVLTLSADYTLQEIELKQILSHSLIMRNISGLGLKKLLFTIYPVIQTQNNTFLSIIRCKLSKVNTLRILGQ